MCTKCLLGGDEHLLKLDTGVGCPTLWIYKKLLSLYRVNFRGYELYLSKGVSWEKWRREKYSLGQGKIEDIRPCNLLLWHPEMGMGQWQEYPSGASLHLFDIRNYPNHYKASK